MHIPGIPDHLFSGLPVRFWATDCDLQVLWSHPNNIGDWKDTGSSICAEKSGRLFIDRNYAWHPFVSAHVRALRGGTIEWRAGTTGEIHARVSPIKDTADIVTGLMGITLDLRGEGNERIRRAGSEMILSKLLKEINQPVSLLDEHMRILMASTSFFDAATIDADDTLLRSLDELIVMHRPEGASGELADGEEYTWDGTGGRRFKSRHLTCSSGDMQFGIEISQDISREECLRAAVTIANRAKSMMLEELTLPAALVDSSARVEQLNEALASMLGTSRETVAGSNLTNWVNPGFREQLTQTHNGMGVGSERLQQEAIFQNATGAAILAKFDLKALPGHDKTHTLTLLKVTDWGDPAERVNSSRAHDISDVDGVILEMPAAGEGNASIAQLLCLSRQGLDYRLKALRRQIDAASRGALVGRAYALGLLEPLAWPPRLRRQ